MGHRGPGRVRPGGGDGRHADDCGERRRQLPVVHPAEGWSDRERRRRRRVVSAGRVALHRRRGPRNDDPDERRAGSFTIQSAYVGVKGDGDGISLELSATGGAAIGPIQASVSRLGFILEVAFHDGNLGPIDLALGFKPPSGVGLSMTSPASAAAASSTTMRRRTSTGHLQLSFYSYKLTRVRPHRDRAADRTRLLARGDGGCGVPADSARTRVHVDRRGRADRREPDPPA